MKVAIRVDASEKIGTGHVMRCLTLAEELRRLGARIVFVCREHPGNFCDYIETKEFKIYRLSWSGQDEGIESIHTLDNQPPHASWLGTSWMRDSDETVDILLQEKVDSLVVDHFGIDARWERKVKDLASAKIAVIDGQLDRPHDCELLVDPNLTKNANQRWSNLVSPNCRLFLGPRFTFLRPEFIEERSKLRTRDGSIKRILIAFGGVDQHNATGMALEAVKKMDFSEITIDVVAGPGNPYRSDLERTCNSFANMNFHFQPSNMASLMAEADLSIGAGGTMAWERCYLGLPTIIISVADNQNENCRTLARKDAAIYLGKLEEVEISTIMESIDFLIRDPGKLCNMEKQSIKIMGKSGSGMEGFCKAILQ